MNTDVKTQESFLDFCQKITVGIDNGKITDPVSVYTEAVTYTPFYDWAVTHSTDVGEMLRRGDRESLERLKALFQKPEIFIYGGAPEAAQLVDAEVQALDVQPVETAAPNKEQGVREVLAAQKSNAASVRRKFAEELARNFYKQVKENALTPVTEEQTERAFREGVESVPVLGHTRAEVEERVADAVARQPGFSDPHYVKTVVESTLDQNPALLDPVWRETVADTAGFVAYSDPAVTAPPEYIETITPAVVRGDEIKSEDIVETARVMRAATALGARGADMGGFALNNFSKNINAADAARPEVQNAVFQEVFKQMWEKTVTAEGFVDKMTAALGPDVVNSPLFQKILASGNDMASRATPAGILSNLSAVANDVVATVSADGDSRAVVMAITTMSRSGAAVPWDPQRFIAAQLYSYNPELFQLIAGKTPLEFILSFGKKEVVGEAVVAGAGAAAKNAGALTFAGIKKAATSTALGLLTKIGLSEAAATAIAGPAGTVVAAVVWLAGPILKTLKNWVVRAADFFLLGSLRAGGVVSSFVAGMINAPPATPDIFDRYWWIIFTAAAIGIPVLFAGFITNTIVPGSFVSSMGGPGREYTGPIEYTGPAPSGPLQCLNYSVSPRVFVDSSTGERIPGGPMTTEQGNIMNAARDAYPQLGLYNCLLNCPSYQAGIYADDYSRHGWWGWTYDDTSIVIYKGFFDAKGDRGIHSQARLIAHELAHELARHNWDIYLSFLHGSTDTPRGYCGPLGTYPGVETEGETFAEAAAMFLTGENLQSRCPAAYTFMNNLFSRCSK